jgi:hypothetical protein
VGILWRELSLFHILVMPGLVPGIHEFAEDGKKKTWMAGTSPAMTRTRHLRV